MISPQRAECPGAVVQSIPQRGFEQPRLKNWGQKIMVPAANLQPCDHRNEEKDNAGLNRAGSIMIHRPAARRRTCEWKNYSTNQNGGMNDRELLAAAQFTRRTRRSGTAASTPANAPRRILISTLASCLGKARGGGRASVINLDPAYVYGLIRQESRAL
jgi:soluble lytic murein transglycosylase